MLFDKIISQSAICRQIKCSRWAELIQSAKFHCGLANAANAVTEFRMLNNGAPVIVGNPADNGSGHNHMIQLLNNSSPGGATPLCRHIREVTAQIRAMESTLRANGHKAVLVIATDGEASDGDVSQALAPLKNLPVWVVLRLCTGEDKVVNYWNNIDSQIELDMDILDDLVAEAEEIHEHNKWFTYGEPLHHLREFGCSVKEIDLLDETKLTPDQIRDVCVILFGGCADDYPHPEASAKDFLSSVSAKNGKVPAVWSPIAKKMRPWIEVGALKSALGKGCVIS